MQCGFKLAFQRRASSCQVICCTCCTLSCSDCPSRTCSTRGCSVSAVCASATAATSDAREVAGWAYRARVAKLKAMKGALAVTTRL